MYHWPLALVATFARALLREFLVPLVPCLRSNIFSGLWPYEGLPVQLTKSGGFATDTNRYFCITAFAVIFQMIVAQPIWDCISCQPVVCANKNTT